MTRAETLANAGHAALAATVTGRGLELSDKLATYLPRVATVFSDTTTAFRHEDNPQWPADPTSTHVDTAKSLRRRLLTLTTQLAEQLVQRPRHPRLPDAFGRFYATLLDEALDALLASDDDLFTELFPPISHAAIGAHDRLRTTLSAGNPEFTLPRMTEPLVDLLELSGAALLLSEVHGGSAWTITTRIWDKLFAAQPDPEQAATMFASALDMREPLNLYNPGLLTRTTRWLRVQRHLSGQDADDVSAWWPFDSNSPTHASAIVRVMTRSPGMHELPQLFAATYLATKFPSVQMPRSVQRLTEALTREITRTSDEQSHDEATATPIDTVEDTTSQPTEATEASEDSDHWGGDQ